LPMPAPRAASITGPPLASVWIRDAICVTRREWRYLVRISLFAFVMCSRYS
jgi:hypothetical protein